MVVAPGQGPVVRSDMRYPWKRKAQSENVPDGNASSQRSNEKPVVCQSALAQQHAQCLLAGCINVHDINWQIAHGYGRYSANNSKVAIP